MVTEKVHAQNCLIHTIYTWLIAVTYGLAAEFGGRKWSGLRGVDESEAVKRAEQDYSTYERDLAADPLQV
jgi:hypothetical protein